MIRGLAGLLLIALIALGVVLSKAGSIYSFKDSLDGVILPRVDAIVCLAGAKGRIAQSADLWTRYYTALAPVGQAVRPAPPMLYISGMGRNTGWDDFLRSVRTGVGHLIQPSFVILEKESENTVQNVQWIIRVANERKWKKVVLVTSAYHMKRALMMFEKIKQVRGSDLQLESFSVVSESFDSQDWMYSLQGIKVTLTEYLKYLYYLRIWDPSYQPL